MFVGSKAGAGKFTAKRFSGKMRGRLPRGSSILAGPCKLCGSSLGRGRRGYRRMRFCRDLVISDLSVPEVTEWFHMVMCLGLAARLSRALEPDGKGLGILCWGLKLVCVCVYSSK